ncbi:MAG: RluA family pseudouridine synthase [Candidatus Nanopelagicaceae bacterium]
MSIEFDKIHEIDLHEDSAGMRYDQVIARELGLSRSALEPLFEQEVITHAKTGKLVRKSDRVTPGDKVFVKIPARKEESEAVVDIPILYEDEDIVVIDKPVGVAAHPSPGWTGPTVTGSLQAMGVQLSSQGADEREGIVHRLDVGTSGVMVVAKSSIAHRALKSQFKDREVSKVYYALAQGHIDPAVGTIDAPIDRHPKEDHRFAVVASGKPSITHYEAMEFFPAVTLLRIELETGRTHQIRVHFSAIKHPLVGDLTYGADPRLAKALSISRPWLHAMELEFSHPRSGERVRFHAPYPADLSESLESLRSSIGG